MKWYFSTQIHHPQISNQVDAAGCVLGRAGKNLRFFKNVFRFLGFLGFLGFFRFFRFLGFNVYAQSHAEHWTQEYDQLKKLYT